MQFNYSALQKNGATVTKSQTIAIIFIVASKILTPAKLEN
jgi:hypothetical protein